MPPPTYIRNVDPSAFLAEKNKKSNFSALQQHLKNSKSKKSSNLDQTAENFAKDPAARVKDFKKDFKSDNGVELQVGFGPLIREYYDLNNLINVDLNILPNYPNREWTDQRMFVKITKKNRDKLSPEEISGKEMTFSWNKDKNVKLACKVSSFIIFPKRATGLITMSNVKTFKIEKRK